MAAAVRRCETGPVALAAATVKALASGRRQDAVRTPKRRCQDAGPSQDAMPGMALFPPRPIAAVETGGTHASHQFGLAAVPGLASDLAAFTGCLSTRAAALWYCPASSRRRLVRGPYAARRGRTHTRSMTLTGQ